MGWYRNTVVPATLLRHIRRHSMYGINNSGGSTSGPGAASILASADPNLLSLDGYYLSHSIMVPRVLATSFHGFCSTNAAAMPLLYVESPGEMLLKEAVKKLDTSPTYNIIQNGKMQRNQEWDINKEDFVTFFFGCGGSLEQVLRDSGVQFPQGAEQTGVFRTALVTPEVDHFGGPLVATLRPIARENLKTTVTVTEQHLHAHGAPIHIGDPAYLGVDLGNPVFGNVPDVKGHVPLFWGCAFTGMFALMKASRAYPDLMFFTCGGFQLFLAEHLISSKLRVQGEGPGGKNTTVVTDIISQPALATVCSMEAEQFISSVSKALAPTEDVDNFLKTSLILSHSSDVTLDARGVEVKRDSPVEAESCVLLASVLQALGKHVIIVTTQPDVYSNALSQMSNYVHAGDQGTIDVHSELKTEPLVNSQESAQPLVNSQESARGKHALAIHHVLRLVQSSDSDAHVGPSQQSHCDNQVRVCTDLVGNDASFKGGQDQAHGVRLDSPRLTKVTRGLTLALLALQLDPTHRRYVTKGFQGQLTKATDKAIEGIIKLQKQDTPYDEKREWKMSDLQLIFGYSLPTAQ